MKKRQLRFLKYMGDPRLLNYYPDEDMYSYYYGTYDFYSDLIPLVDYAPFQDSAKEDYENGEGRVVLYEELYGWSD